MNKQRVAKELLKLAKELTSSDEERAYQMLTGRGGQKLIDQLVGWAGLVESEYDDQRGVVERLESQFGSGVAEAPVLLERVHQRVKKLKALVDSMDSAMSKALR